MIPHAEYNIMIEMLRQYFKLKGYTEVFTQDKVSILSACEDPTTMATFKFSDTLWPMKQTNQMDLEAILLKNPTLKGLYCVTTSYRDEPNPIPGRHDKIFPMFEFEGRGDMSDLADLEYGLIEKIFKHKKSMIQVNNYESLCARFKVDELGPTHEEFVCRGNIISAIQFFPERTHPFWNMKKNENGNYNKIDIIINGVETIGSAERETDINIMRERFYTVSNGEYAKTLFEHFGKERVVNELDEYLSLPMISRFGGGIGLTRFIKGMRAFGII